jgi:hypothetical protein
MKRLFMMLVGLALAGSVSSAHAHDAGARPDESGAVDAHATAEGNTVEGSVIVPGTVAALKSKLYLLERWPRVFTDVRGLRRNADGTWSIDFRRFGHPHDFRFVRTPAGVVFELAAKDHGRARLEYLLEPVDATRSRLTVRLVATTPKQLTTEQFVGILRAKAQADLADFTIDATSK